MTRLRTASAWFWISRGVTMASAVSVAAHACAPKLEADEPRAPAPAPPASIIVAVPEPEPEPESAKEAVLEPAGRTALGPSWSTFHGANERTGQTSARPIRSPAIRWKAWVGVQSWLNSPLVDESGVVVPSCGKAHNKPDPADGVRALDVATGEELWHARFDGDANGATIVGDRVFATSDDGHLYALDRASGKIVWKVRGKGKMYTHPLATGDLIVVGDEKGWVRAVARDDGKSRFELQFVGAIRGGAAADGRRIYVVSVGGDAAALDRDGREIWRATITRPPWGGRGRDVPIEVYSPPIVVGDLVVIPFARDTYYAGVPALIALDRRSGRPRWRATGPEDWGNIRSTPALAHGTLVYSEPYSGDVVGIDVSSGRATFRRTIDSCYFPQWGTPAVAGDVAYVPRFGGTLFAVSTLDGSVQWEAYLGDSQKAGGPTPRALHQEGCSWEVAGGWPLYSPVAIAPDGAVLSGSEEGYLYAIEEDRAAPPGAR